MAKRIELPNPPLSSGTTELPDGRHLGWAEFGDPSGDVVFWFPGTPGGRLQVPADTSVEAAKRRLRVICVERPGTGDSSSHHYDQIIDFTDDLQAVIEHHDVDRFAVVGLSGGGPYTLATAHVYGDRMTCGVVLGGIGPTRGPDAVLSHTLALVPVAPLVQRVAQPVNTLLSKVVRTLAPYGEPVMDAFFWLMIGDRAAMGSAPETKRQMIADLVDAADRSGLGAPLMDLALFGRHWGFEIGDIDVPITFWGGTSDVIVPYFHAERQAKRVPGARLRTVQKRGHFAGYTEVAEVFDVIREQWPVVRPARKKAAAPKRGATTAKPASKAAKAAPRSARVARS